MKCLIFAVFLLCTFLPSAYSRHMPFYRKGYTYVEEFDAFYKVHVSGSAWNTAFLTCDDEGATLFYPKAQGEWTLVKNLTDKMIEVLNVSDIFVGFHDEFKLGEFITVDGHSTPYPLPANKSLLPHIDHCIAMNIDTGKFKVESCSGSSNTPLPPFVCKKVDDESCPTVDHGYKFLKESRKCYKINEKPQKWQEGMKTCFMEGGILAVIENSAQAQEIKDILDPEETYFVGVRKLLPRNDYYTVKGQKFNEMYQNPYNFPIPYESVQKMYNNGQNEYGVFPDENGQYPDDNHVLLSTNCGTVSYQNNYNLHTGTQDCAETLPFICEMEVGV